MKGTKLKKLVEIAASACTCAVLSMQPAHAATVNWVDTTGFWDITGNWDLGIPAAADDAIINVSGTHTITVRPTGGPFTVNSISMTGNETLAITGNTLTVNGVSTLNALTHTGGILTGIGNVTVTGTAALNGGSHQGSGQTIIGNTATGTLGSNFGLGSGRQLVNNSANLSAATGNLDLNSSGRGGSGSITNNGILTVNPGVSFFRIFASNFFGGNDNGADALFTNAGTLVKNGVGGLFVDTRFTNAGTLAINEGEVNLRRASIHQSGSSISGAGTLVLAVGHSIYDDLLNICVWNKSNAGMGSLYRSKHEMVFVQRVGTGPHANMVELGRHGRNRTNVWDYPSVNSMAGSRREDLALHPTVKPVAMVADAFQDVTKRGDLVFDMFLGSGTSLIAAERTGRRFRGCDIDPAYVDVAIDRWCLLTGRIPELDQSA